MLQGILFCIALPLLWNSIPFDVLSQPAAPIIKPQAILCACAL